MAVRANRRSKSPRILVPATVNPTYREVLAAIAGNQNRCVSRRCRSIRGSGTIALDALDAYRGEDITALVIQQPNFFGVLEDVDPLTDWAHAARHARDRGRQSDVARDSEAAGRVGHAGRRHRLRRGPTARRAAVLGRAVLRLHDDAHGARAPDAGPHRRPHRRSRRQARLHADAAGARAAHPPRQGDLEHLHQPGPAGDGGDDLPVAARRRTGSRVSPPPASTRTARARRGADATSRRAARLRSAALPRGSAAARPPGSGRARGARCARHRRRP